MRPFFHPLYYFILFSLGCTLSPPASYDTYNPGSTGYPGPGWNPNPFGGDPNNPSGGDPNNPPGGDPDNPFINYPTNPFPKNPYGDIGNPPPVERRDLTFPYELIPDTLTALTCPVGVQIAGRPFTLSLGAYVNHGLQLSPFFLEKNNITEDTDPQKTRQIIERSPVKNARARFAIQDESDLRRIYGKGNDGQPLQAWFPPFNNPSTLDHLSRLIPVFTTRSISSNIVGRGGKFEASLPMSGGELSYFAEGLAPSNPGVYILTLTYSMDGKSPLLSDTGLPYGRGYKLEFADQYRADYLINVQEDYLPTTEAEGNWNCPEQLVFPIHRSESKERSPFNIQYPSYQQDAPNLSLESYCSTENNPSLSRSQARFFETVFGTSNLNRLPFKIGKTAHFDGNQSYPTDETCIVFKRRGCYPSGYYRIEFNRNQIDDCVQYGNFQAPQDRYSVCPAFLSVCYRVIDD